MFHSVVATAGYDRATNGSWGPARRAFRPAGVDRATRGSGEVSGAPWLRLAITFEVTRPLRSTDMAGSCYSIVLAVAEQLQGLFMFPRPQTQPERTSFTPLTVTIPTLPPDLMVDPLRCRCSRYNHTVRYGRQNPCMSPATQGGYVVERRSL